MTVTTAPSARSRRRIRVWLPVLTALTANSPFWQGEDTGYASYRSQVWRRWPSAGSTDVFPDAAAYHRLVDSILATDTVLDSDQLYFDARLSEKWPTVEVRTADVALHVEDAVSVAGLVRSWRQPPATARPAPQVATEILRLAAWRAGRSGLTGHLVHPVTGQPTPAADGLATPLRRGTGADLQRRVHRETGDLATVVRVAVAVTSSQDPDASDAPATATG